MSIELGSKICEFLQHEIADIILVQVNSCDDDVEALEFLTKSYVQVNTFVQTLDLPPNSKLVIPIYKPYTPHLYNFGKMIQQKLFIQLNEIQIDSENFTDALHKFESSIDKTFQLLFQALEICDTFTGGLAIDSTLPALNKFLSKFAMKCSLFLKNLWRKWKLQSGEVLTESECWRAFSDSIQLISCTGDLII